MEFVCKERKGERGGWWMGRRREGRSEPNAKAKMYVPSHPPTSPLLPRPSVGDGYGGRRGGKEGQEKTVELVTPKERKNK